MAVTFYEDRNPTFINDNEKGNSDDDDDEIDEIKADQTLSSSSLGCNDDGDDDR